MKKKIVACLLCMAMAVSTVPMPMVQAAEDNAGIVLYEEGTDTENGEVTTVAADEVQYAKLTGLTGTADSEELTGEKNGNGPIAKALDGKTDTYWHTNWKDDTAPKAETDGTKLTGNNNYIVTLAKPSTVTAVTYVPRNGYESSSGKVNNGAIEQCNVYVTTDDTNWTLAGTIGENNAWSYVNQGVAGADQNFVEKTITFAQAYTGVTKVKIEAIKTAGPQPNQFINAAEFGVIGKENTTQEVLAAALEAAKDVKAKENYTEESYDAYEKALAAVNAITEESTDEEVQAAAKALQKAIAELVEVHKHTLTKTEAKAATCTEAGNSEYYTCSECGKYFSDAAGKNEIAENSWVIEAKGHKLNKTEEKAATCTEAGNSEYYTCSDCGKYFSDADGKNEIAENSWVIEATGHALTKTEAKAATCTEAGNSEYYTCSDCGKYFSDAEGKNEIAENSWVIEATGHALTKTEAKAATCTEAGNSEYYTCSDCGKYFSDAEGKNEIAENSWVIEAKGHKLTKTEEKAATCTEAGNSEYYTCSECGKYFSDAEGKNEIAENSWVIEAKGHKLTKTEEKAATCTEAGNSEYYTCSECGKYFSDAEGKNEIAENSWVIEAKGHKLNKTEAKAATCTEAGNSEYYTCSDCGKYFSDAEGKNEIEENSWVIEAKGHKLTKTEAKAATCTEAGNSEYYTCSDCGKYFSDAEGKNEIAENSWVIEAKGHKLTKTEAKAATCTEAGNSEYYTCGDCKKYFSDVAGKNEIAKDSWVIKAKGHTITKKETPATADKEGKIEYSCDVCKDYVEKTFVLPKTETSVYMGKTANLISDASKCSITLANAKKYKKYFTLDTKTGKIKTSTKKLSKVKIKKTIPVKVTVDGKAYNVNVKLKIAAPKIKIKRKKIVIGGVSGYRYELQYNIKGATRVKIRVKKMSVLNKKFDANMSKPKSSKSRCYINASSSGLKKLGNKLTFEIVAYYGKNVSQKFIKRI
ncbi:MAG: discoidin domain-containing protein [Lachnospiraceae bacterium]